MSQMVRYICNDLPNLKINVRCIDGQVRQVAFAGGLYATDDEELQDGIEKNNHFGNQIHWQDDPSEIRAKEEAEQNAANQARKEANRQAELQNESERQAREKRIAEEEADRQKLAALRNAQKQQAKQDVSSRDRALEGIAAQLGG